MSDKATLVEFIERELMDAMRERALANTGERFEGPSISDMAERIADVVDAYRRGRI